MVWLVMGVAIWVWPVMGMVGDGWDCYEVLSSVANA